MDAKQFTDEEFTKAELQLLSKEDLIARVVELNREKAGLLRKLSAYSEKEGVRLINQNSGCSGEKPSISVFSKGGITSEVKILTKDSKRSNRSSSKQRPFDFTRYHKRHIALKMAYLGWDFDGFASQETSENTIESHLFAALSKACLIESRADCNYSRCGRTDKGVSAFAQVVSLDVRTDLAEGKGIVKTGDESKVKERIGKTNMLVEISYCRVLNKLLPAEIKILAWTPVEQGFDARFSCLHRVYKYFFPAANLDVHLMNYAAQKFVGEHDFRNFCKMDVANGVVQFERKVLYVAVRQINAASEASDGYGMCELTVAGSAFLWHQVRCMVAVLLLIGQNLETPEVIDWMLDIKQCPRRPQYNMASDKPLVLFECVYENLVWKHDPCVLENPMKDFQSQWTGFSTKAIMLKNLVDRLDDGAVDTGSVVTSEGRELRDSEQSDKMVPWRDIKQPRFYQLLPLLPCQGVRKTHTPLKKRALHDSFESKLESVNAKRRKAGKEEFVGKATDTPAAK